ncbi:MAG: hypothetical protein JXA03_16895, partial [Bacteroidales bacterium]|nr:hypothetical protein [Bacteroidales bacterium]
SQGGNGNGEADFGESILLDMEIENLGAQQANNVNGTLTTTDTYITLTDDTENFGDIPGSASVNEPGAFAFDISGDVPDGHTVTFNLVLQSGTETWNSSFSITVNAPELQTGNIVINDGAGGNGNGMLDPGETAFIQIATLNSGNAATPECFGNLSTLTPFITVSQGSYNLGSIAAGAQTDAVFQIIVDSATPIGASVDLVYSAVAGGYATGNTFYQTIGIVMEDWESGDFSKFGWETGGNAAWTVVADNPYEGSYCAKSGSMGDNQSTSLALMMNVTAAGNISFFRKVSSEANYDYLRFFIDGSQKEQWSGSVAWGEVVYPVTPGIHTFQWTYVKDANTIGGSDCAWIDYIVFPPAGPLSPMTVPYSTHFDFGGALPEGWSNALTDDFDWTTNSGSTPSSGTGPSGDHTSGSGYYAFTESSSPNNPGKTTLLVTPVFDLGNLVDAQVTFWYHMYGAAMGSLCLDIFAGGAWINNVMPAISGNQGDQWLQKTIDITPYAGQQIKLRFRGITGTSYTSDMAIDDFSIAGTAGNYIHLDLKALLQGPFNGTEMQCFLNTYGYLPQTQPYNIEPYFYTGTETANPIPNGNIVDWVLVELRETAGPANTATPATMTGRKAGFVLRDGTITESDGVSLMEFSLTPVNDLYVVIWHRNHLGIMSNYPLSSSGLVYSYDYSSSQDKVYGGANAHRELAPGIWGMAAGDGNCDGQVSTGDKIEVWVVQSGTSGYLQGDFNMNSNVENGDKIDIWAPNAGLGSQVPQ